VKSIDNIEGQLLYQSAAFGVAFSRNQSVLYLSILKPSLFPDIPRKHSLKALELFNPIGVSLRLPLS
jgi:hypothetical protein